MELPPKLVGQEVARRERGISPTPPADGGHDADSLPVLGAFGEFLEAERRRARTRMWILSGFFLLLFILVAGAALLTGALFYQRMQADVQVMETEMNRLQTRAEDRHTQTRDALHRLEEGARSLLDSLAQQEEALAQTRSSVDAERSDVEQELADMEQLVKLLEVENTALKKDVQHVASRLPGLVATIEELVQRSGRDAAEKDAEEGTGLREMDGLPPSFEFSLLPVGASRALAWRLPIPE